MRERLDIQRIPRVFEGFCGLPLLQTAAQTFGIPTYSQSEMLKYISNRSWGSDQDEMRNIACTMFPETHVLAKEDWTFRDLIKILRERVVVIANMTDILPRYDIDLKRPVPHDAADGHYVIIRSVTRVDGEYHVNIIDPSRDEIVQPAKGIAVCGENVYSLCATRFMSIWCDLKKNGYLNWHWLMVMLDPKEDPRILDKHRGGQLALELPIVTSTPSFAVAERV